MPPPVVIPLHIRVAGNPTDADLATTKTKATHGISSSLQAAGKTAPAGKIRAALAASRWDDAYYLFNGLPLEQMRKVYRALPAAGRAALEANLETSGLDRQRMFLGIQQAKEGDAFWNRTSYAVFAAIRAGDLAGAYWIINGQNEPARADVMRFLHSDDLRALRELPPTTEIPHFQDIRHNIDAEFRRRKAMSPDPALALLAGLRAPKLTFSVTGNHPDEARIVAALEEAAKQALGVQPADTRPVAQIQSGPAPVNAEDAEADRKFKRREAEQSYRALAGRLDGTKEAYRLLHPSASTVVANAAAAEAGVQLEQFARDEATSLLHGHFAGIEEYEQTLDAFENAFVQATLALTFELLNNFEHKLKEARQHYADDTNVTALMAAATAGSAPALLAQAKEIDPLSAELTPYSGWEVAKAGPTTRDDAAKLRKTADTELRNLPGQPLVADEKFPRTVLVTGDRTAVRKAIFDYVSARLADIAMSRELLRKDPKSVFRLPKILKESKAKLGITAGSVLDDIVEDRASRYAIREALPSVYYTVLDFALWLFAFAVPPLAIPAAVAGFASGVAQARLEYTEYEAESALADAGLLDDHKSFAWVVLAMVGPAFDVGHATAIVGKPAVTAAIRAFNKSGIVADLKPLISQLPHAVGTRLELAAAERSTLRTAYRKFLGALFVAGANGPMNALNELGAFVALLLRIGKGRVVTFSRFIQEMRVTGAITAAEETAENLRLLEEGLPHANDVLQDLQQTGRSLKLSDEEFGGVVERWTATPSRKVDEVKADLAEVARMKRISAESARTVLDWENPDPKIGFPLLKRAANPDLVPRVRYESGLMGKVAPGSQHMVTLVYDRKNVTYVCENVPMNIDRIGETFVDMKLALEHSIDIAPDKSPIPVPVTRQQTIHVDRKDLPASLFADAATEQEWAELPAEIRDRLAKQPALVTAWKKSPDATALLRKDLRFLEAVSGPDGAEHLQLLQEILDGADERGRMGVAELLTFVTPQGGDGVGAMIRRIHERVFVVVADPANPMAMIKQRRDVYQAYFAVGEEIAGIFKRSPATWERAAFILTREQQGTDGARKLATEKWKMVDQNFVTPLRGNQGFDSIWWDPSTSTYVIIEYKGGPHAELGNPTYGVQMGNDWVNHHIRELKKRDYQPWAASLETALDRGDLFGVTVQTADGKTWVEEWHGRYWKNTW